MSKLPTLYHLSKSGALYDWQVWTEGANIISETGQVDGKHVRSEKLAIPKNTGKANATTAAEQAVKEAESMHKNKLDRKYSLTPEEAKLEDIQPMLCKKFVDRKLKVKYPVDVQPKLDGARALARWDGDKVILTSRGHQEWRIPQHINRELEKYLPREAIVDGELYIHGEMLNELMSWTKKKYPETANIEFHVYDMPCDEDGDASLTWKERRIALETWFKSVPADSCIKPVLIETANNEAEVEVLFEKYTDEDHLYEGIVLRFLNATYIYGHRSAELLKYKLEEDDEFEVVGFKEGRGKYVGCVIWKCKAPNGEIFDVNPACNFTKKKQYYKDAEQYIGRLLTVRYQNYSVYGKPQKPIGKTFRPIEDLPKQ